MKINLRNIMLSFQEALKNSAQNFVPFVNIGLKVLYPDGIARTGY
jgi:hypothetical protein